MSFVDTLLLWLHVGFAIFALGPVTIAVMTTPRYIRAGDVAVVRFLNRTTRIYGLLSVGVLAFGIARGRDILDQMWLSASMTLFVVTLVLLFALVERDQRKALRAMESPDAADDARVEVGRIAGVGGVISAIWVVVLILMFWH